MSRAELQDKYGVAAVRAGAGWRGALIVEGRLVELLAGHDIRALAGELLAVADLCERFDPAAGIAAAEPVDWPDAPLPEGVPSDSAGQPEAAPEPVGMAVAKGWWPVAEAASPAPAVAPGPEPEPQPEPAPRVTGRAGQASQRPGAMVERNAEILARLAAGERKSALAKAYGVSWARIDQIEKAALRRDETPTAETRTAGDGDRCEGSAPEGTSGAAVGRDFRPANADQHHAGGGDPAASSAQGAASRQAPTKSRANAGDEARRDQTREARAECVRPKPAIDWARVAAAHRDRPVAPRESAAPAVLEPALSPEPCPRCGIPGRKGCAHQAPYAEWTPTPELKRQARRLPPRA